MKHMSRIELEKFIIKYFRVYGKDIKKVSYIIYEDRIEYLINDHYLYSKMS